MSELNYSIELSGVRVGHLQIIGVMTELEGEDFQKVNIVERENVTALNFGKIFFGAGTITVRARRKNIL